MASDGRVRVTALQKAWRAAARFCRAGRRVARDTSGAAAVEFALVAWPFLLMVLASLQISIIFLMNQAIQTATVQAGRSYMTGQDTTLTQANFKSQVCGHLPALFNCSNLVVDIETSSTASALNTAPITPYTCTTPPPLPVVCSPIAGNYTASAPSTFAIVRVYYDFPVIGGLLAGATQADGSFLMQGTSVFEVEPYPTSS